MSASAVMTVWTANRKACVRLSAVALPNEADLMGGVFVVILDDTSTVEETMVDCLNDTKGVYYPPL